MTERKFKDLKPGEKFKYGDVELVALGEEQGGILAVAVEPLRNIPFDTDNKNDWRTSSLRKYLNGEYLEKNLDPDALMAFTSDLTSDDGMTDYGTSEDRVFLLSADLYRKYRYRLPKWKTWMWLITPDSCLEKYDSLERGVYTDGSLGHSIADNGFGAAPACLLNPESPLIRADRREESEENSVPLAEHVSLLRRFKHLLQSNFISSFDEWNPNTHDYRRDIAEADRICKIGTCYNCIHRQYSYIEDRRFYSCEYDTGDPHQLGRDADEDNWFCADWEEKT